MVTIGPINLPANGIAFTGANVEFRINEHKIGVGTVYVTQNFLIWQGDNMTDGITVPWKDISVHGVATTVTKCIYFMMDQMVIWPGIYEPTGTNGHCTDQLIDTDGDDKDKDNDNENGEFDDYLIFDDEEPMEISECWLIPQDGNMIRSLFLAMNECQSLNPDTDDSEDSMDDYDEDDEGDYNIGENDEDNVLGYASSDDDDANGASRGLGNININDDRFADADE